MKHVDFSTLFCLLCLTSFLCFSFCASGEERLLFVSDLHLSHSGDNRAEILEAVASYAVQDNVLIFLGDNTDNGRDEEHTALLAALEAMRKNGAEIYVLPGNHDLCGNTTPEVFARRYGHFGYGQAFSIAPDSASYAVMTKGGTCLLMLDVNRYDASRRMADHGEISEQLLAWVGKVLSELDAHTQVVACGHYPLLPTEGATDGTIGAAEMVKLLEAMKVSVWMCGHRHNHETRALNGLRQVTVGTPWSYPVWIGILEQTQAAWCYSVEPLFSESGERWASMKNSAYELGLAMAGGSLKDTPYEGDEEAIRWFATAFLAQLDNTLWAKQEELRKDPNCEKWRKADVRSVTKAWILGLLDSELGDVRHVEIPKR